MFSWYHWLIIAIPIIGVCYAAIHCRRYIRSVSDFLVAGRCAGRYVLLTGAMMGDLSVITFVGSTEAYYNNGWIYGFWDSVLAPVFLLVQRNWAGGVLPWLVRHGWDGGVRHLLEALSRPFAPWVDWAVSDAEWVTKFPINSREISLIAGIAALIFYVVVSLCTCREPFNLERMLHRGKWADKGEEERKLARDAEYKAKRGFLRRLLDHLVGITPEHTRGDRVIAWVVFFRSMVIGFLGCFIGVAIAGKVFHWGIREWAMRMFVVGLVIPLIQGAITTVWYTWGTIRDLKRLFLDLEARKRDNLDNGMVEGHVSLVDKARDGGDSPRASAP